MPPHELGNVGPEIRLRHDRLERWNRATGPACDFAHDLGHVIRFACRKCCDGQRHAPLAVQIGADLVNGKVPSL